MMPMVPMPDSVPIPAPVWVMHFLLLLTFTLHLVPMSFVLGGGILGAVSAFRGRRDERHRRLSGVLFRALPAVAALAITTGVAPLLFLQVVYGPLFYTSSVLMAWPWLGMVPLLILGYYGYYACALASRYLGERRAWVAALSALAFTAVAALWVMNVLLMLSPGRWMALHASGISGLHLNLDPVVGPRLAHLMAGALAVSGMWVAVLSLTQRRADPEFAGWMRRQGVGWFTGATLANVAVGAWFLFSLPTQARALFGGGMTPTAQLLAIGIVLAAAALGLVRVHPALGAAPLLGAVALMALVRHRVRLAYLGPHFSPVAQATDPQWGVLTLFVVLLVAGLAVIAWMAFVFLKAGRKPEPADGAAKPAA